MDDFEKELKQGFLEESEQLLNEVEQYYLQLEDNPNDTTIIDKIFRVAHNIKGSSRAVGFSEVGHFAHGFENLLLKIKEGSMIPNNKVVSLMLRCNDFLHQIVIALKEDMSASFDGSELLAEIDDAIEGRLHVEPEEEIEDLPIDEDLQNANIENVPDASSFKEEDVIAPQEPTISKEAQISNETVDPTESLEPTEASESMTLAKDDMSRVNDLNVGASSAGASKGLTAAAGGPPSAGATASSGTPPADESIRVSLGRLEKLLNYVGEMVVLQAVLREQTQNSSLLIRKTVHQLGKVTKEVQEISMGLRMLPIKQTFHKMQRIVRDTSGALGKKVKLVLEGEETELDKTILERISDPLVHLVRNACDHGVEMPEQRVAAGKPELGTIFLSAYHQSGKLIVEVADDGGGINAEFLKKKAIEKKIISANAQLTEKEALNLIFHPGFSTKAVVTDVSGRGVGMDVVKSNIDSIQGDILLETEVGKGTTFKVILPLTLAIIDAMVVTHNELRYIIPLSHVHESVKLEQTDVKKTSGLGDILLLRGENIPLYYLNDLLNKKSLNSVNDKTNSIAIVVKNGEEVFAVVVDDIIGQYQVVIKKLGDEIHGLKGISGSAILGDGRPALILELADLINGTHKKTHRSEAKGVAI